ncbi:DedA family protein [Pedococcus sp. 5OH_020]|uniref:DedA family protein n=1 Tax=Pedococcus sp. 5OH_020 TaxID=2989814 RepID=UPI0022EA06A0|nr:VTT domain-containing protein [Pedococcus sp. 5OH_020]
MATAYPERMMHSLGTSWMDPQWLLDHFGSQFFWVSVAIVFVECGLLFPVLPGDSLLFAIGLFVSGGDLRMNLVVALLVLGVAAFAGNVVGYEIGRAAGRPLYERDGRILKKKYFDDSHAFFERHGAKALVLGRFVPVVRTFITVVAGVSRMERRHFFVWSGVGAALWVCVVTLLGYFLGNSFPALKDHLELAILAIVAVSVIPMAIEVVRSRRGTTASETVTEETGEAVQDLTDRRP